MNTLGARSNVLGIDISTRALDLVLLDENADQAHWRHIPLSQEPNRIYLAHSIRDNLPSRRWYSEHGVYLIAVEQPFGPQRQTIAALNLVLGATLSSLPQLPTWLIPPAEWKRAIGLAGNARTTDGNDELTSWAHAHGAGPHWPTDAHVALAISWTAREQNAAAITRALGAT